MRRFAFAVAVPVIALLCPSAAFLNDRPAKSKRPLSADEIAIYKAVLQQYTSNERQPLNISVRTFPLEPTSLRSGLSNSECLKGIQLELPSTISHSFHDLTPEVLIRTNMKLVDPSKQAKLVHSNDPSKTMRSEKSVDKAVKDAFATGLFSMSEIAFDKEHHHAAVSYSFRCGSLCGHGATMIFERVGNEWERKDRHCGGWIS
jgi:hypothetical protein